MKRIVVLALLFALPARADWLDDFERECRAKGGTPIHNPNGGGHCEMPSGSSSSSNAPMNPQAAKAVVNTFGAIAFILILPIAPMHVIMLVAPKQTEAQKAEDRKRSNDAFKKVKAEISTREYRGREADKLARQLDDAELAAVDEVAAAKSRAKPVPFNPPKLVPSESYSCTRAEIVMWYREGWPLEGFKSKEDYQARCGPFTPEELAQPIDKDTNACNPALLTCGGTTWCCPLNTPLFNPCNTKCYRTPHDIFGATEEFGMRCNRYTDCGSNIK